LLLVSDYFFRSTFLYSKGGGHCVTSRKVAGSNPDEVIEFFSIDLICPTALGLGVYSASNRNEYQQQKNNVSGEKSAAGV
jgi:hypothetical protein